MKAITLRSGKELKELKVKSKNEDKKNVTKEKQSMEIQKLEENEVIPRRIHFPNNPYPYVPLMPYH